MESESPQVNILLVDDNSSNLLALETILEREDRRLVRAASGDEALQYLLYNDVAVILLDVRMPGIDGLETAALIRGRKKSRDVPIIFLTAYDSPDNKELLRGYSLGAVDYLIKPVDPDALTSKVAVFVELFKKTEKVKQQAALLHEKNIQLENANFERLGKLVELGRRLTAEREPEQLLQLFCDAARDIVGARYASVSIMDTDGQSVRHVVESGVNAAAAAVVGIASIAGTLMNEVRAVHQPIRAPNAKFPKPTGDVLSSYSSTNSMLAAPISLPERTIGWLYLADRVDVQEFSEADERLAMTLTSQLAVAYENARLYSELLSEVTDRKRAQEEKERLLISEKAARLEAEQAQRLSSELLIREKEARVEAEQANRLKDEFLATVSHELRTPLNAVLGFANLLGQRKLDEAGTLNAAEIIERNARTLTRIVGDILDASRIITGKLNLHLRPLELVPIVEAAADVLRPTADAKRVSVELVLARGAGCIVAGDADRLQQIVWNLLSNAIKFTAAGGQVQVTLQRTDDHADLKVSDTGQGITPEFLPYVFDRFRQADSSTTRRYGGLGLGLAIVRHLVDLHGGTVSADSAGKEKGATFTVSLPLAGLPSGENDIDVGRSHSEWFPESDVPSGQVLSLAGLQVLIVDDEPDSFDLLMTMIERHGGEARGANSTSEALEILERWKPHILLSDIGMRGEDGYDLIRRVRALAPERGGAIPAAAITGYATSDDRSRALSAGYQAHMAKPIDAVRLIRIVSTLAKGEVENTDRGEV